MKNNTYIIQVKETYTVSVAVQAEGEDAAYDKLEGLVNDDVIDPVALALADGDYSRNCEVVKKLKRGETLPDGVKEFK